MKIYRAEVNSWYIERITSFLAGFFVFSSIVAGLWFNNICLLYFAAFVGFMLMLYALTGICPSAIVLHTLGVPSLLEKHQNHKP